MVLSTRGEDDNDEEEEVKVCADVTTCAVLATTIGTAVAPPTPTPAPPLETIFGHTFGEAA